MNNFITQYKTLARNKNISIQDVIARCLYKAVKAKNPNKKEVLIGLLRRSFTPGAVRAHRPYPFYKVELEFGYARFRLKSKVLGLELKDLLTEEELAIWNDLISNETYWEVVRNLRKG